MPTEWQSKPLWKSRTFLSLAVAIAAMVLRFFGIDVDLGQITADHVLTLGEVVAVAFSVVAHFFNYKRTGPLTLGSDSPTG